MVEMEFNLLPEQLVPVKCHTKNMLIRILPRLLSLTSKSVHRSLRYASVTSKVDDIRYAQVTHVIFDLDGLLIDSEPLFVEVNKRVMAKYGKEYTIELKKLTLGMSQLPGIELVLDKVGLKGKVSVKEYAAEYDALLPELLPQCSLMKGAMRFVRHLAEHNIPRAICTGSPDLECSIKLTNHKELRDLIPLIVRGSDPEIRRGKPAPDCFLVTMNRFEKKPKSSRNILVFEDSINGTRAAISANMQAIMIPDVRFTTPPKELIAQTRMILNSFDEFKPESVGLPAYK